MRRNPATPPQRLCWRRGGAQEVPGSQGPGAGGGPHAEAQTSQELLTFSRKQGGSWKGQGAEMGRGSAVGSHTLRGVQKVPSSPSEEILPTRCP